MDEESESIPRLIKLLEDYNSNSPDIDKPNTIQAIKTIIENRKKKMIQQLENTGRIQELRDKGEYTETTPQFETQIELTVLANKFNKMFKDKLYLLILFCQQEYRPDEVPKVIKDTYDRGGKRKSRKTKKRKSRKSRKSKKRRSRK